MQLFQCDLQPQLQETHRTTQTETHPKQLQGTVTLRQEKNDKPTAAAPAAQTRYLSSSPAATLHGKTQGFVLRLPPHNIAHATFMQPFQCNLQLEIQEPHRSTHTDTTTRCKTHSYSFVMYWYIMYCYIMYCYMIYHPSSRSISLLLTLLWCIGTLCIVILCIVIWSTTLPQGQFHCFLFFCDVLVHYVLLYYVLSYDLPPFLKVNFIASYSFVMYWYIMYCYMIYHRSS